MRERARERESERAKERKSERARERERESEAQLHLINIHHNPAMYFVDTMICFT